MSTAVVERRQPVASRSERLPQVSPVDRLARRITRDPVCDERWLDGLYDQFVLRRNLPQPGDLYSRELPPLVERRGGQDVVLSEQVFTGVTPEGVFVQLLADRSGYHKLVRLSGRLGYQEPPVTGGGNSDEVIRAEFWKSRYPYVGIDVTYENDAWACSAVTTEGDYQPVYEIVDVLVAIGKNKIIPFWAYESRSTDSGGECCTA